MAVYSVRLLGDCVMRFSMDATNAAAPIYLESDTGEMESAVFQTADASHDPDEAADLLNEWLAIQGGAAWSFDDFVEVLKDEDELTDVSEQGTCDD